MGLLQRLFGGSNEAKLKDIYKIADATEALEPEIKALSDDALRAKTIEFKERLKNGETLDDLLPEAFAVVREASIRTLGMRHFRVQLVGGVVLHQGRIAEMKTGEGKTLVATLPAYLNALEGKGVHIVTVNDYLARRDSEWMGKIFKFLGMSVGLVVHGQDPASKRQSYAADVTYGTNNEFGFDYLRDNMVVSRENMAQRELSFAIVDEVDSILIDEARTPLIISGQGEKSTDMYEKADRFVKRLKDEDHYTYDEKQNTCNLTEEGVKVTEAHFDVENLSDVENTELSHHVNQALKARTLMKRDKDYVVQDGQVIIVDEFTGRLMTGRRYSDGLHQAIEAKEGVKVERENRTMATITFQNYFRMYRKLSGMTGTAKTEETEFQGIYGLDVVEIPTNMSMIRKDENDIIFARETAKLNAVIEDVIERHKTGQPVLVGTITVEKSEMLSAMLKRRGVKHEVLNAKFHQKEAEIVAQAGKFGAVTIATNMAGRGTDIILGGNPDFLARREMKRLQYEESIIEEATGHADTDDEAVIAARAKYRELYNKFKAECDEEHEKVIAVGGLAIIGTERHESRRIDNQLRGRSGRQGDPGVSRFYISLEDDLMRLFGGERLQALMSRLDPEGDMPLEYGVLSKQIEAAQKRVEERNFDSRKHVLQYDDVMNKQREVMYSQRRNVLMGGDISGQIKDMTDSLIDEVIELYIGGERPDYKAVCDYIRRIFAIELCEDDAVKVSKKELSERLKTATEEIYAKKEQELTESGADMREIERVVLLNVVDRLWTDHIDNMDQLRQGISLRAYGNHNPVVEYTREGFDMFEEMTGAIREDTIRMLYHISARKQPVRRQAVKTVEGRSGGPAQPVKTATKVGRNAPCSCGSGKKYKNCCGREAGAQ
ncbi:MAG: preprotein translocase subunit SecA [Christensenellales bacterium]|jgi:preprotein translocase subunit SecA